jgi:hypothetical protein
MTANGILAGAKKVWLHVAGFAALTVGFLAGGQYLGVLWTTVLSFFAFRVYSEVMDWRGGFDTAGKAGIDLASQAVGILTGALIAFLVWKL